jgi:hypothetical protein
MTEARIRCVVCGAMPYPPGPEIRQDFDLLKLDQAGQPTEGEGRWYCSRHQRDAKVEEAVKAAQPSK